MRIGDAIAAGLAELGLSPEAASRAIGKPDDYLQRILDAGRAGPLSPAVQRRLADLLGVPAFVLRAPSAPVEPGASTVEKFPPRLRLIETPGAAALSQPAAGSSVPQRRVRPL